MCSARSSRLMAQNDEQWAATRAAFARETQKERERGSAQVCHSIRLSCERLPLRAFASKRLSLASLFIASLQLTKGALQEEWSSLERQQRNSRYC